MAQGAAPLSPAAPEGSARSSQFQMIYLDSAPVANATQGRGGGSLRSIFTLSNNWGLAGDPTSSLYHRGGVWWRQRAGVTGMDRRMPIVNVRPAFRSWSPISQLYVVVVVLSWPNNNLAIATENGVFFSYRNFAQTNTQQGFMLCNDTGTLQLRVNGPTGIATTAIAGVDPLATNKFRFEFRQPTSQTDGGLRVLVNDSQTPAFSMTAMDANWPDPVSAFSSSGLSFYVGTRSAVEYVYFRDLMFYEGPDTTSGM